MKFKSFQILQFIKEQRIKDIFLEQVEYLMINNSQKIKDESPGQSNYKNGNKPQNDAGKDFENNKAGSKQKLQLFGKKVKKQTQSKNINFQQKNTFQVQLRPQTSQLLSFQYLIKFPQKINNFDELLKLAKQGIQKNILKLQYSLKNQHLLRYGITQKAITLANQQPFMQEQNQLVNKILNICTQLIQKKDYNTVTKSLSDLNGILSNSCKICHCQGYSDNSSANQLSQCQNQKGQKQIKNQPHPAEQQQISQPQTSQNYKKTLIQCLHLAPKYTSFNLNFRYINIKQAIIYESLSRCQIWFTICRQRRKSKKSFYMDPLINMFEFIVKKMELVGNPFHISVLPRRNIQHIEKKIRIQKSNNILFEAVKNRKYNEVKQLILNGADLQAKAIGDQRIAKQLRCAHKAAQNNDLQMCKILTSFGVNWQSQDSQGMSPVFYAIHHRAFQVLKYLVQQVKINIQKQQCQNRTPFYWACTEGELTYIKYLYQHGANINQRSKLGRCPLSKACFLGRKDIVQFLLSCKQIDIYSQDSKGRSALHNAVFGAKGGRQGQKFGTNSSDSPQCAQLLLQKGFQVDFLDFQQNTSLHIASSSQALDSIRLLMAYGASLTAINNYGQTPMMTASKFGHLETVKLLYEEFNSSIITKDIFNKNILLLVAKFRQYKQNTANKFPVQGTIQERSKFRKKNSQINQAFRYIVDKFVYELSKKIHQIKKDQKIQQQCKNEAITQPNVGYQSKNSISKTDKNEYLQQLHYSFKQMLYNGVQQEFILFCQKIFQYNLPFPQLTLHDAKFLIQIEQLLQENKQKQVILKILKSKNSQGYHVFQLQKQGVEEFIKWIIKKNNVSLLEFLSNNQVLVFYHFNIYTHLEETQPFYELPMKILVDSLHQLKQKVISFCLLNFTMNWIEYLHQNTGQNIFHLLVKYRKVGTLIQLVKFLSGKKMGFVRNRYLIDITEKEENIEKQTKQGYDFSQSNLNKLCLKMISQEDNHGISPYQLAHIIKQSSLVKLFSERLKQNQMLQSQKNRLNTMKQQNSIPSQKYINALQKWDVKEYKIQKQTQNEHEMNVFNMGYQIQSQLVKMQEKILNAQTIQQLGQTVKILVLNYENKEETNNDEQGQIQIQKHALSEWDKILHKKRKMHFIKTIQQIQVLKQIVHPESKNFVVGIDVQYDFADGKQTIICTLQFSTIEVDYIVDMMSCTFQDGKNRYVQFVKKLKEEFFLPLCYDSKITKLMHGSDHDLYILKSCFNCSFLNFLDSSRIDIEYRKQSGIRGLSTLVKQYLNIQMSKDHQVSEWRIRPIPFAMLDYARRDSMILPFLVYKMIQLFKKQRNINELKEMIINGFRHAKKNKKPNQPLIRNLIPI